jgi:hypothetical protein
MIRTMIKEQFMDAGVKSAFKNMMISLFTEEIDAKFDALGTRVAALEAREAALEAKVQVLDTKISNQQNVLTNQIVSTEQRSIMVQSGKANNIIISGIEETLNEKPADIVAKLATDIAVKLGSYTAKRIGKTKTNKIRPILVVCDTYWDKRKLYGARTTLKDKGYTNVYINEDLPPTQGEIFYHARQAKNQKLIKSTWSENGTIQIKPLDTEQALPVSSLDKLKELIPDYAMP